MSKMTSEQMRRWALSMYLNENRTQAEIAEACGVSRQTISLIERGDYSPSVTLALTIAKVCGVTVEEVFYLQEDEKQ